MGKKFLFAITFALAFMGCASANPMQWNKHQWRSDLQRTDHVNTHRQNLRNPMRVVTRVIVLKPAAAVSQSMPVPSVTPAARPKFITIGARDQAPVNVQSAPGTHRTCKGMLVLTWNGQKAVPSCRRVLSKARVVSGP